MIMKKILFAILSVFAMVACVKEELPGVAEQLDDQKVTLTFDVKIPALASATRAMGVESIQNLTVVVYNEESYWVETASATLLNGNDVPTASNTKSFSVQLNSSSSERRIHFIANGDATQIQNLKGGHEDAIAGLSVTGDQDAYWQRMVYAGGIGTAAETFGGDGRVIPLVRNYARVAVENKASDFTLTGYKVFNTRTEASVATYDENAGGWVDFSKDDLAAKSYVELSGYTPLEMGGLQSSADYVAPEAYTYVRETKNVKDDANHPYVIICGTRSGDDAIHYYKLDFVYDQSGWANILRNFEYKFVINSVEKDGCEDEDAAKAQSSGENSLSYDVGTESFLNISDGTGQLFVNATTVILVNGEQKFELKYKYIPDVQGAKDVTSNGDVTVGGLEGDVIESYERATSDVNGWRSIVIDPNNPPVDGRYEQTVRLSTETGLARDVKFILRAPYSLKVNAYDGISEDRNDEEIPAAMSNDNPDPEHYAPVRVWVDVTIPADLPESIFPLEFIFETEDNTLSPDAAANNMPVRIGQSIITGSTSTATTFGFVYTLSRSDYDDLEATDGKKTFTAKFKPTTAASATRVWVDNLYFAKDKDSASDDFENSKAEKTKTISVTLSGNASYYGAGQTATATISLEGAPAGTAVDVVINGFTVTGVTAGSEVTTKAVSGKYATDASGKIVLQLSTDSWAGTRSVAASCDGTIETDTAIVTYTNGSDSTTVNELHIPAQKILWSGHGIGSGTGDASVYLMRNGTRINMSIGTCSRHNNGQNNEVDVPIDDLKYDEKLYLYVKRDNNNTVKYSNYYFTPSDIIETTDSFDRFSWQTSLPNSRIN